MMGIALLMVAINFVWPMPQTTGFSNNNKPYYTAGVVEFSPSSNIMSSAHSRLEDNLKGYVDIIMSTNTTDTDIIIFPEMTLNSNAEATFVPDPSRNLIAPCDITETEHGEKYHDFLIELSCLAKNQSKYIVINVCEKAYCEPKEMDPRPCAETNLNIFNTNVVFDRNGNIISRYRKVHLWGEARNTTYIRSYEYFDTDFGVRFGQFICFDILFYMPAQKLVNELGIRNFVFPTMWFSQLPFLTAVQIQSAWSYANDVNLLAAGASRPFVGNTGTGIYAGRQGAIHAYISQNIGERRIFIAQLQKELPSKNFTAFRNSASVVSDNRIPSRVLLKRDELEYYDTVLVDLNNGNSLFKELCQHNETKKTKFCCHFDLEWTELHLISNDDLLTNEKNVERYYYRLAVFNGLRKEEAPESNLLRNCAVIACTGSDIGDCGKIFNHSVSRHVQFERLVIEAIYPNAPKMLIMPNSLKEDLLPVDTSDFEWNDFRKEGSSSRKVRFSLSAPISNLLTFSIYGNYFDSNVLDKQNSCDQNLAEELCDGGRGDNGSISIAFSLNLIVFCVVIKKML